MTGKVKGYSDFFKGPRFDFNGFTQDHVKNEPMFFNSSIDYAYDNGGPITRAFLDAVLAVDDLDEGVFDSRVHMLMPGWYPCIPGFHHDDVPRSEADGQPNYFTPEYRSQHAMGLVNGEICPTEFAVGPFEYEVPEGIIYKEWHQQVVKDLEEGTMESYHAPSGVVLYFDDRSFHQGTPAVANGWRWFGRLSWDTERTKHVTNEIRRQVQVYLEHPMEGW